MVWPVTSRRYWLEQGRLGAVTYERPFIGWSSSCGFEPGAPPTEAWDVVGGPSPRWRRRRGVPLAIKIQN